MFAREGTIEAGSKRGGGSRAVASPREARVASANSVATRAAPQLADDAARGRATRCREKRLGSGPQVPYRRFIRGFGRRDDIRDLGRCGLAPPFGEYGLERRSNAMLGSRTIPGRQSL